MPSLVLRTDDVYTPRELALAAGVAEDEVRALVAAGEIHTCAAGAFIARAEAVRAGRDILSRRATEATVPAALFSSPQSSGPSTRAPLAASGLAHAAVVTALVVITTLGLGRTTMLADVPGSTSSRLVFLALPGPGGGGGGGGARQKIAPAKAERAGTRAISSPVLARRKPDPPVAPRPRDPEPPQAAEEPPPPVEAPVAVAPSDARTQDGVLDDTAARNDSRGPGADGGVGTGEGTGVGEGDGSGIGDGSDRGAGGGPYGPGSGVDAPSLLAEVKPDYTEQARRNGIEGDVLLEIIVLRNGAVGDVRVVQGLGHGLDERAVQAVRQWRFAPARRKGIAVDVKVEVAVEFRIR